MAVCPDDDVSVIEDGPGESYDPTPAFPVAPAGTDTVVDLDEPLLDEPDDDDERDDEPMLDLLLALGVDLDAIHEIGDRLPTCLGPVDALRRPEPEEDYEEEAAA